jgi:tagaturonate epimerase
MIKIGKYSFGIGDRFAMQGKYQLKAMIMAGKAGISVIPVWNKSNREHQIIHSKPEETRIEADRAVKELGWKNDYFVDADHINMGNVDSFVDYCNFFTIDVADYIGKKANESDIIQFVKDNRKYIGELRIPGITEPFNITEEKLTSIGSKFLFATQEAYKIYSHIAVKKGIGNFVTEVSMDEVDEAQSPVEMFFILSMLGKSGVPAQTIAPKFTGRFNKGVDYVGDLKQFSKEFEQDLLVIDLAIKEFRLPDTLKLSVHSGSDKFSIYPVMGKLIKKHNKGIHIKTAGTTWLEEVIGLAVAGGEALGLAKSIYAKAYGRKDELCGPYATVIDIDNSKLPEPSEVEKWSSQKFANTLRHIPDHPDYNPSFRQLIHVGYKVAAEYGNDYLSMLNTHADIVGKQVTENIFDRHLKRLFDLKG